MLSYYLKGGSVAEWLACWTQAQKGLSSNCSFSERMTETSIEFTITKLLWKLLICTVFWVSVVMLLQVLSRCHIVLLLLSLDMQTEFCIFILMFG